MKHIVIKPAGLVLALAVLLMGSTQASASSAGADGADGAQALATKASKAKKRAGGSNGQIRFLPGSAETVKERSSRLKRECKGRENAGACAGYTG